MPADNLYPHLWRLVAEAAERRRVAWQALTTPAAVRTRQAAVREAVTRLIGPFPERCELAAQVTGSVDHSDYRIELVHYRSRPGLIVTGSLYLPTARGDGPHPAVLAPCGHAANGRMYAEYQRVAAGLARQGYVVLTYDPLSQGERVQYLDGQGQGRLRGCCDEHCMVGNQLELVGANFANYRIWDGVRSLDYLLGRPEVDPARVGVTGCSGGGTLTTYLLMVDDRFAAGAPVCYVTTFLHRIATRQSADSEQQFRDWLAEGFEAADLLLPAAPKPVLLLAAEQDFFPIEGTRRVLDELRFVYRAFDRETNVDLFSIDAGHAYSREHREAMIRWFGRHLKGVDEAYQEPDLPVDDDPTLFATRTGQVLTADLGARPMFAVMREEFPPRLACRAAPEPAAAVREALPRLLRVDPALARTPWPRPVMPPSEPTPVPVPAGASVDELRFLSDFDVELTGWLLTPSAPNGEGVVLLPDSPGSAAALAGDDTARAHLAAGRTVLAVDPRGVGGGLGDLPAGFVERQRYDFYGLEVEKVYTSWMVGRPLLGQRVFDLLCAVEQLRRRGLRPSLDGVGQGGLLALLAAALDDTVVAVTARSFLASWAVLFGTDVYAWLPDVVLPGALTELDLPDVVATLAPRPVTLVAPLDGERRPLAPAAAADVFALALAAYRTAGAAGRLILQPGAGGEPT